MATAAGLRRIPVTLDRAELEPLLDRFRGEFTADSASRLRQENRRRPALCARAKAPAGGARPVQVNVYSLDLGSMENNEAAVRVHCSAGTYLRSIAHDAGQLSAAERS